MARLFSYLLFIFCSKLCASESVINFSLATAQLPPYVYLDENKEVKGILIDILKQAEIASSLKIEVFVMPWGRAVNEVKANRIDAIMPALWTQERTEFFVYPHRSFYSLDHSVLIKRVDDPFEFTSLSKISSDKTIGKARLVLIDSEFDQLVKQGKLSIYETTKLDEALLMLMQQKIDLVASDSHIAMTTIRNLGLDNQFTLFALHDSASASYIAFSRAFAQKQDINKVMDMILNQKGFE